MKFILAMHTPVKDLDAVFGDCRIYFVHFVDKNTLVDCLGVMIAQLTDWLVLFMTQPVAMSCFYLSLTISLHK